MIMIKNAAIIVAVLALVVGIATSVSAQMMPTLYNSYGVEMNTVGGVPVPAGWYYTQPNGQGTQVYYYGNGMFYNPSTGIYGGSIKNPNGTAGYNYGNYYAQGLPGVPNTGVGGETGKMFMTLLGVLALSFAGLLYATRPRSSSNG